MVKKLTKILLICHDVPSMTVGATLPLYHLVKQLGNKYDIHLVSFDSGKYDVSELEDYLDNVDTLPIPEYLNVKDQLKYTVKNMINTDNLSTRSFLNYYYHKDMKKLIKSFLDDVDVIITDMPMAFYVKSVEIPKIVYAFDAVSDYNYNMYRKASNLTSRVYWYLNYLKIHNYEKVYNNFDSCILVNRKDKEILERDIHTRLEVIPNGVDTEYFRNVSDVFDNRIVFLGDMSTPPNNDAVRYFMDEIYPHVNSIPFWIVGRNPSDYIKQLGSVENIHVTGSVLDVREYLTPGSIFVTPMISGTGIKNKILEAMSMGLAVVSTSIGIDGIDAEDDKEYLLADDPEIFAQHIIKLSENREVSEIIGENARKFVYSKYSWETSMHKMDMIIRNIIT